MIWSQPNFDQNFLHENWTLTHTHTVMGRAERWLLWILAVSHVQLWSQLGDRLWTFRSCSPTSQSDSCFSSHLLICLSSIYESAVLESTNCHELPCISAEGEQWVCRTDEKQLHSEKNPEKHPTLPSGWRWDWSWNDMLNGSRKETPPWQDRYNTLQDLNCLAFQWGGDRRRRRWRRRRRRLNQRSGFGSFQPPERELKSLEGFSSGSCGWVMWPCSNHGWCQRDAFVNEEENTFPCVRLRKPSL